MNAIRKPLLSFRSVTIHRADVNALRDLNWRIGAGENWAVIGPNGAGKSSLAAAITGNANISGEIEYGFGADDADPCERIASVSFQLQRQFVAQSDGYYQSRWYLGEEHATLTAAQALGLARRDREGVSHSRSLVVAARKNIAAILEHMGLSNVLERQTLHLSTGEMRRLLIARALLLSPALLILDEPFIGLDIQGRAALANAFHAIMNGGKSAAAPFNAPTLFLTARPWEIPRGFTHGLYLRDGRAIGTARLWSREAALLERAAFRDRGAVRVPAVKKSGIGHAQVRGSAGRLEAGAPIIDLRNIRVKAGDTLILNELNWTVRAGEHWAVLGPNGVGKTTLLSLLTGDHPQSYAQHVSIFGKQRREQSTWDLKAKIGYAAPDIALHYDGSTQTLDFVCTGFCETLGLYHRVSPQQKRIAWDWLEYFGLDSFAARPFRLLSDGHQRLALLARALVKQPRLLILDEPCQGLDKCARKKVCDALDALCATKPTTLIIVSHYIEELPRCITNRLEMLRGLPPRVRRESGGVALRATGRRDAGGTISR
ncbi:MAG TPA: ATP-binding cassette domain-containing protein [Planctomycetota bacterium]|nr:ATP-binding cassette domain-containing protein [Planctomycetota bacterium]